MVFKRRDQRGILQKAQEFFYPKGGWRRAVSYLYYRVRRLPDPPHRIARGIAVGIFVSFTPFFGFHFMLAAALSFLIRGNVVASIIATFFGNPLTFPFIAAISLRLGEQLMGLKTTVPLPQVFTAFSRASAQLWHNLLTPVTGAPAHWDQLATFFDGVFLPYLMGCLLPGFAAGLVGYYVSYPVIAAYQNRRARILKEKLQAKLRVDP